MKKLEHQCQGGRLLIFRATGSSSSSYFLSWDLNICLLCPCDWDGKMLRLPGRF